MVENTKAIGYRRTDNSVSLRRPKGCMAIPKQKRALPLLNFGNRGWEGVFNAEAGCVQAAVIGG
jgi:hypothetical protein